MDRQERERIEAIGGGAVGAIPSAARRIIVAGPAGARTEDVVGVEAAGGIVRMAARHSSRLAAPAGDAA